MKTLIQTTLKQPTWRWDYVTSLVNSNIFPKCSDDVYIKSAFGFANKYKKICNSTQIIDAENQAPLPAATVKRLTALYAQYPYVSTAFDMHEGGKFSAKSLEAMVLAKVPQEDLVAAYGLPLETIKTYEALFFDVRERLDSAPLAVLDGVLGDSLNSTAPITPDILWKQMAMTKDGIELLLSQWHPDGSVTSEQAIRTFTKTQLNRRLLGAVSRVRGHQDFIEGAMSMLQEPTDTDKKYTELIDRLLATANIVKKGIDTPVDSREELRSSDVIQRLAATTISPEQMKSDRVEELKKLLPQEETEEERRDKARQAKLDAIARLRGLKHKSTPALPGHKT